jgi:hypothetical protein
VDDGHGQIQPSDGEEIGGEIGGDFFKGASAAPEDLGALFSGVKSLISGLNPVVAPEI